MLRFRIGPIPVLVHLSHLLISGLLAWSFAQSVTGTGWPADILANPNHPSNRMTFMIVTLVWVAIISVSVLIHELGHAMAFRLFGYKAAIQLVGMGGQTQRLMNQAGEPAPELPWHHELFITLAGPISGLSLGLLAGLGLFVGQLVGRLPDAAGYVLQGVFAANLFWAVLNLMPVAPLDGGAISRVLLMRLFGRRGFLFAQILTLIVAAAAVALGVYSGAMVLSFLFSLYGFRAVSLINAYRRGEAPVGSAAHPATATLAEAESLASQGKLDEAANLARGVIAANAPAALTARAHAVLGWVQVKRGDGPGALKEFESADPNTLPPHALAAAHSLSGDEASALPLWERAAGGGDSVIRHEWAGSLIRAGREIEARRLPDLRLSLAFAAAERVHFLRHEYAQAASMAEASFREEPSVTAAYDAACAWALANEPIAAMRCLTLATQNGFDDAEAARQDPDLKSLRGTAPFENWLSGLDTKQA